VLDSWGLLGILAPFGGSVLHVNTAPYTRAQVAQLVEQGIENPRVGGSIPSLGTADPAFGGKFESDVALGGAMSAVGAADPAATVTGAAVGLADGGGQARGEIVHRQAAVDALYHARVGVAHERCDQMRHRPGLAQPGGAGAPQVVWGAGLDAGAVARLREITADVLPGQEEGALDSVGTVERIPH
jgi:hypothetical protein